jgi:hypothetical protein
MSRKTKRRFEECTCRVEVGRPPARHTTGANLPHTQSISTRAPSLPPSLPKSWAVRPCYTALYVNRIGHRTRSWNGHKGTPASWHLAVLQGSFKVKPVRTDIEGSLKSATAGNIRSTCHSSHGQTALWCCCCWGVNCCYCHTVDRRNIVVTVTLLTVKLLVLLSHCWQKNYCCYCHTVDSRTIVTVTLLTAELLLLLSHCWQENYYCYCHTVDSRIIVTVTLLTVELLLL